VGHEPRLGNNHKKTIQKETTFINMELDFIGHACLFSNDEMAVIDRRNGRAFKR
jgi:hypothetical protein